MRSRKKIKKELEGAQASAASVANLQAPQDTAMQAGANAPVIATAATLLVEVALDIRESLRRCEGQLGFVYGEVLALQDRLDLDNPIDEALVIEPAHQEALEKQATEGKLPGFEPEEIGEHIIKDAAEELGKELGVDKVLEEEKKEETKCLCPKCGEMLVLDVAGEGVRHTCPGCGYSQDQR